MCDMHIIAKLHKLCASSLRTMKIASDKNVVSQQQNLVSQQQNLVYTHFTIYCLKHRAIHSVLNAKLT